MFKLISDQERFWFRLDSNLDGSFTISDLPTLLHQLFFLPGDLVYYFLYQISYQTPPLGKYFMVVMKFFEIENMSGLYGNVLSGMFSFFAWLIAYFVLYAISVDFFGKD